MPLEMVVVQVKAFRVFCFGGGGGGEAKQREVPFSIFGDPADIAAFTSQIQCASIKASGTLLGHET